MKAKIVDPRNPPKNPSKLLFGDKLVNFVFPNDLPIK